MSEANEQWEERKEMRSIELIEDFQCNFNKHFASLVKMNRTLKAPSPLSHSHIGR